MFLTVKEASDLTGKSATTIYRLCNKRKNSLYIKKEDNKFYINKEFLLATYPVDEKRISEEIEHGSVEITEPVFLEIEPKKTEEVSTIENKEIAPIIIEKKEPESVKEPVNEENPKVEAILNEGHNQNLNQESIVKPDSQKDGSLEKYVGLSICVVAIVALLFMFYYFAK